ncbi:spermine oxidase-like [Oppia nitens]|uniref:spermine oxidase-like n=1 Tax=Oppia nitens TaxID=1686743 RepID=UPI0023DAC91A|nr:spermine oxidase-like [Oppia nitens]
MNKCVAIIGAGIAGLTAAQKLYENGFNDITIYEALDRIGGRIHTIPFDNGVLELGAQWLHGQHGNPLYHLAKERDLISNPNIDFGIEGTGIFCTDSGDLLNNTDINKVIEFLNRIKDQISDHSLETNQLMSAQQVFRDNFEKYIKTQECPPLDTDLLWSLFNWYIKFEVIDNSCNDLNDISLLSYTQYDECDGIDLINLKNGYKTIIDSLVNEFPKNVINLRHCVKRIEICNKNNKQNMDTFFGFILPKNKINIIKTLGFGTINKIYLYFDKPFWSSDDNGFQFVWTKHSNHSLPDWVYDITGFDLVRGQPNVLVGWIGGNGAIQMEKVPNCQMIGDICFRVLKQFLPNMTIERPSKVICSKWWSNEYVCGAYSNRSLNYQKLNLDIESLSEPIVCETKYSNLSNRYIDYPLILFGGEATDRQFYSTTHGAMRSGLREAQRLIEFYNKLNVLDISKL